MSLMPAIGQAAWCCDSWGGIMDMTPDGSPVIDRTHVGRALTSTARWCYGGFKAVPASGFALAHLMATGTPARTARDSGSTGFAYRTRAHGRGGHRCASTTFTEGGPARQKGAVRPLCRLRRHSPLEVNFGADDRGRGMRLTVRSAGIATWAGVSPCRVRRGLHGFRDRRGRMVAQWVTTTCTIATIRPARHAVPLVSRPLRRMARGDAGYG